MYYIKTDGGVKIAVEDIYPKGRHTVFFIHGWPLSRKIFEYQYNVLPSCGFRCISVDLRGFGQSDSPADGYSYNQLANDIYTVVQNANVRSMTLAGFSMGGAIALRYMTLYRGFRVSKLALLAAAAPCFTQRPDYPYGMAKEDVNQLINKIYRDRPQAVAEFGEQLFAVPHSGDLRDWFKDISWSASGHGTIQTAISLRDEDLRPDLKHVNVPTGIFHGKKDLICPYDFALQLHDSIKNSKLYTFEESGHAVFYDELEHFNEHFLGFLSEA